jgi:hypothetical protein
MIDSWPNMIVEKAVVSVLDKFATSPVENGEIVQPYLYFLRNRSSNSTNFTDIERHGAP